MSPRISALITITLLTTSLAAQSPRTRDSAGVHIVENGARVSAPVAFTMSTTPTMDFGGLKDNPADEFSTRFFGNYVFRLASGGYVIGDHTQIRYYDAAGKQVKVAGKDGQGPGEFRQIFKFCVVRGDTVVAYDNMNARLSLWDRTGNLVKESRLASSAYLPRASCLSDGTFITSTQGAATPAGRTIQIQRRRLDGTVAAELGEFWSHGPTFSVYPTPNGAVTAGNDRFYVGDTRSSEVRGYDLSGKLISIIRTSDLPEKVSAAEAARMTPLVTGVNGTATPETPKPTIWPSYGEITTDPSGRLWMQSTHKVQSDPWVWIAFDREGKMLGKLTLPGQVKSGDPTLLRFTEDGVVIRREDADGALHLSIYKLVPK